MKFIVSDVSQLKNFLWDKIPPRPELKKVLFVRPDFYDVKYVINPHMKGNLQKVNKENAMRQWKKVENTYTSLGLEIVERNGEENFPDMVFCANQSLSLMHKEKKIAVISRMATEQRKGEVQACKEPCAKSAGRYCFMIHNSKSFNCLTSL